MSANNNLSLTSLDFDTLKSNFKTWLASQSVFKDYDYTGSNINTLLDVMSYNTYLNSFFLNMVASEAFLDSAQKYSSVVSNIKGLNYLPSSASSPEANINMTIDVSGISSPFTIPKGTIFSGSNSNGTFQFVTNSASVYNFTGNVINVANLSIFEGTYFTDTYIVDYSQQPYQSFVFSNPNIDINSLEIVVTENNVNTVFTYTETLYNLSNQSNVYFLQATQNYQYEFLFGDNVFGRLPVNFATVTATYRITNGTDGAYISSFVNTEDLGVINGGTAIVSNVVVTANSSSGANTQSIASIKFSAPRYFATQQRAVGDQDYKALILDNFGGQIADVNVYGGELLNPKQYGYTAICLKSSVGTIVPDYLKNQILLFLSKKNVVPILPFVTDPDYIYIVVNSTVYYNTSLITITTSELENEIMTEIVSYTNTNLTIFEGDFRLSKFSAMIDNSDVSVISNDTDIKLAKRITPTIQYSTSYILDFNNPIFTNAVNIDDGFNTTSAFYTIPSVTSSSFAYSLKGVSYPTCYIRDDNIGNLCIYTVVNGQFTILNSNIGTVNYATGEILMNSLYVDNYTSYIEIMVIPLNNDIIVNQNQILLIDTADVTINVTTDS